jgi:aryl sulfotransferase
MPGAARQFQNALMDSTVWNGFEFHDGDVVVVSWGKSGTTWMQQIVAQLVFDASDDLAMNTISHWYDARIATPEVRAMIQRQAHRRILKTHQLADALPISPEAKYIYLARDGRDAVWSLYNHFSNMLQPVFDAFNDAPGRVGPPAERPQGSAADYFRAWMENGGFPLSPFWDNVRGWWNLRGQPNVRLVHFNDLKADLAGQMQAIAQFLGAPAAGESFTRAVSHCGFDYMKRHADRMAPRGGVAWAGGGETFIHKGTNGRWGDALLPAEVLAYEARAVAELGGECAAWLAHGSLLQMNGG